MIVYISMVDALLLKNIPLPPTVNKAYKNIGKGRRALTTEGKSFKRRLIDSVIPRFSVDPLAKDLIQDNVALDVSITLHLHNIENKGWPKKCKTRYKRIDISNRIKLLEDALFDCFGVDDCNVFRLTVAKEGVETTPPRSYVSVEIRRFDDGNTGGGS